jgi:Kef-type K+ transport system membrane component KefB
VLKKTDKKISKSDFTIVRYYSFIVLLILCTLAYTLAKLWKNCREQRARIINKYVVGFLLLFLAGVGIGVYSEYKMLKMKKNKLYLYCSIGGTLLVLIFLYYVHSFASLIKTANDPRRGVEGWKWCREDETFSRKDTKDILKI